MGLDGIEDMGIRDVTAFGGSETRNIRGYREASWCSSVCISCLFYLLTVLLKYKLCCILKTSGAELVVYHKMHKWQASRRTGPKSAVRRVVASHLLALCLHLDLPNDYNESVEIEHEEATEIGM